MNFVSLIKDCVAPIKAVVLNVAVMVFVAPIMILPATAADCSASAQTVIAQTGGELLSATPQTKNGQAVCKVTVLVKSGGGQRPKKMSVTVPQ
jgi:hypothetical protein